MTRKAHAHKHDETVVDVIRRVARRHHIPPRVAIAIAQVESGLNPRAVGDSGTSFGLYQLHRGGELGSHSAAWAFDPRHNAETSLSVVERVRRQHPDWTWGQVAAGAQRPLDPTGYAQKVDARLGDLKGKPLPASELVGSVSNLDDVGTDSLSTWITSHLLAVGVLIIILVLVVRK